MRVSFTKMHGLGNDFVVIDAREKALPDALAPAIVAALANRNTGIGCDQLILLEAAGPDPARLEPAGEESVNGESANGESANGDSTQTADFSMRIFNQDGGEVEACGNATRAVALLAGGTSRIATAGGLLEARADQNGIAVNMGEPRFDWESIPLAYAMDTLSMPVGWGALENPVAVNIGNPHAVFFVDDCDTVELSETGPVIEHDPVFPARINVNVATIVDRSNIRLRVWERGVGETRACGTGACATAIAAMQRGFVERKVTVTLPGGPLTIGWGKDNRITMTGPAAESYRGSFEWDDFA